MYLGTYYTAQICLNGHVITDSANTSAELQEKFCSKCGAETIMQCLNCNADIRGYYFIPGFLDFISNYEKPLFCYNCGKPYPWTTEILEAAKELIELDTNLNQGDKKILNNDLNNIVLETPRTQAAITRFKAITKKALSTTTEGLKQILIDIVSETVKKSIWP